MTEVWFRNPHAYVKELAEVGGKKLVAWDRGMLVKKRIDAVMHAKLYFGEDDDFEILCIGGQGTVHLDKDHGMENPIAVYPTWEYGEDFSILEEMVANPIGEDASAYEDMSLPTDQRPVANQPHRVIITNLPNVNLTAHRPFYRHLRELQEEYSNCIMYLHGSYSYRTMFGMGFGAADVDPRTIAANGRVNLPNGKEMPYARTVSHLQWVNLLGFSVTDLKIPRNRCMFNIKSANWCGENFTSDVNFKTRGTVEVDPDSPHTMIPVTVTSGSRAGALSGDKVTCDTCSLTGSCKLAREGAVCSVEGSETSPLAKAFQSRDSGRILDGLGTILAAQTNRLEKGMKSEDEFGELDPEVTKMMNSLFANGVKLAKLVDPTLTKPLVQINNGAGAVAGSNAKELGAQVIRALEDQGIARENISPEMFESMLLKMTGGPAPATNAIEGHIV